MMAEGEENEDQKQKDSFLSARSRTHFDITSTHSVNWTERNLYCAYFLHPDTGVNIGRRVGDVGSGSPLNWNDTVTPQTIYTSKCSKQVLCMQLNSHIQENSSVSEANKPFQLPLLMLLWPTY